MSGTGTGLLTFTWYDANNKIVGTQADLTNVPAGVYKVLLHDENKDPTYHYFLLDQNGTESNPGVIVYSPNQPTSIALKLTSGVKFTLISTDPHLCETVLGTYLLSQPAYYIDTSQVTIRNDACGNHTGAIVNLHMDNLGFFAVNVTQTTNFFITHTVGQCESPATAVTVNVAAPNVIIPNTFTPNNDGINDYWLVKGLEQFPGTTVDIFNRNGEIIYHSIGYGKPFDGLYSGKKLTAA
eukprot:gene14420-14543_t